LLVKRGAGLEAALLWLAELDDAQCNAHHPRKRCDNISAFPQRSLVGKHAFLKIGLLVALFVGGTAASATGQIVSIRQGTFVISSFGSLPVGALDISGTRGFKFEAVTSGGAFPAVRCALEPSCPPGTVVGLEGEWSGPDVGGTVRLQGATYEEIGSNATHHNAVIMVSGQVTMPPMSDGPRTITVPFDFAGRFSYEVEDPLSVESVLLIGGGSVTLFLEPLESYPGFESWSITRAEFVFRPVKR
jgi:hypothetical protein